MAAEKKITSRIQQKHDTAANWANATTFIPKKGEIVIYDAEYNTSGVQTQAVRFKIGDGSRTINNLPFALIDYDNRITSLESTVNGLGTAAQKDVGFFATAAQGTKADNAVPNTRKVNNKALSTDIKLEPSDVGVTESAFPGLKKTGTITGITMNGASKGTSGVVDLGTVLTSSDNLAKLDTENTFTAKQTINSGYGTVSLKTQGYVEINASWLSGNLGGLLGIKRDDTSGRIYAVATKNLGLVSAIRINNSTKQPDGDCVVDLGTVLTTHQTIKTLNTDNNTSQTVSASESISGSGTINLHKVAKTGSYNDLLNTPAAVTESTVSGWGFTKNTGTVTSVAVKMNGATKGTVTSSGTIDLGTVITSHQDISGLMPKTGGTFTGNVTFSSGQGHLKTDLIKSADDSKWIAEITAAGLEIGGSGTPLRFYSSTRPVVANQNKELAYTSDIPTFELSGDTLIINF